MFGRSNRTPPTNTEHANAVFGRIGWFSPPGLIAAVLIIGGSFVFCWGWIAPAPDTPGDVLNVTPAFALAVFACYLALSTDIRLRDGAYVQVDGFFLTRTFPIADIAEISADNGLRFHLMSGDVVMSSAYPASLLGRTLHYPRARAAKDRLSKILQANSSTCEGSGTEPTVSLRTFDIAVGLALSLALILTTLGINAAT